MPAVRNKFLLAAGLLPLAGAVAGGGGGGKANAPPRSRHGLKKQAVEVTADGHVKAVKDVEEDDDAKFGLSEVESAKHDFMRMDHDGDGFVSFAEFQAASPGEALAKLVGQKVINDAILGDDQEESKTVEDILSDFSLDGPLTTMCTFRWWAGTNTKQTASCSYNPPKDDPLKDAPDALCAPDIKGGGDELGQLTLTRVNAATDLGDCTAKGQTDILRCFFTPKGSGEEVPLLFYDRDNKLAKTQTAVEKPSWLFAWLVASKPMKSYGVEDPNVFPAFFAGNLGAELKSKVEALQEKFAEALPGLRCLASDADWPQQ